MMNGAAKLSLWQTSGCIITTLSLAPPSVGVAVCGPEEAESSDESLTFRSRNYVKQEKRENIFRGIIILGITL